MGSLHCKITGICGECSVVSISHATEHKKSSNKSGNAEHFSWEKLNRGGFQTRGFPTFFGKGPDSVADPFGTVPRRRC